MLSASTWQNTTFTSKAGHTNPRFIDFHSLSLSSPLLSFHVQATLHYPTNLPTRDQTQNIRDRVLLPRKQERNKGSNEKTKNYQKRRVARSSKIRQQQHHRTPCEEETPADANIILPRSVNALPLGTQLDSEQNKSCTLQTQRPQLVRSIRSCVPLSICPL